MSKATRKRMRRRQQYLARLAENDPEKFRRQWAKRLESWSNLARRQANLLVDLRRRPVAPCFQIARRAIEELAACGEAALALEGECTRAAMGSECAKAVAAVVDPRLYRLSNAASRREKGSAGSGPRAAAG